MSVGPLGVARRPWQRQEHVLAVCCSIEAARLLEGTDRAGGHLLETFRPPMVPIYVELRKVFSYGDGIGIDEFIDEGVLWNYLSYEFDRSSPAPVSPALRREALRGQAIIMLDGIDEVPVPQGRTR